MLKNLKESPSETEEGEDMLKDYLKEEEEPPQ